MVEQYAYDAYGTPTVFDGSGAIQASASEGNRFLYTGREWDEALALYHYRARMYDSASGRFCSRDPIGYFGSPWDLYGYVASNPQGELDPTRLTIFDPNDPFDIFPPFPEIDIPLLPPKMPKDNPPPGVPKVPPSGRVTEPGALDSEDYFKDLLEDELMRRIWEENLRDRWEDWWDERNPWRRESPIAPPIGPRPKPPWRREIERKVRPRIRGDGIGIDIEISNNDRCPSTDQS